ncbi:MAG: helix-turn-helix transcriptional regulator [Fibrobacter sp.]|uniref:helix-turn-helix domain-containing protein n=1 Tax=Fibrobacter sp. TaxID=35828 RepID=UPI002A91CD80|nr:helix-turn-helix transcriptional regulator [Fibrobacter sp.]MDY6263469.1 helix-turn-helix transcriptional regulator [Fibrobacter sp.]
MATYSAQTDKSALALLGRRMAAFRIRSNWTQAQLAEQAGVSKGTVEHIERGDSVQVLNLIKVLRVCGMLETFLAIFPDDSPSPMQILRMGEVKARKRVRNPHSANNPRSANNSLGTSAPRGTGATNVNANSVAENSAEYVAGSAAPNAKGKTSAAKTKRKTPWVWGEDK